MRLLTVMLYVNQLIHCCRTQIFQHVLNELAPVCLAEQDFCVHFFQLAAEGSSQVRTIHVTDSVSFEPFHMPKVFGSSIDGRVGIMILSHAHGRMHKLQNFLPVLTRMHTRGTPHIEFFLDKSESVPIFVYNSYKQKY